MQERLAAVASRNERKRAAKARHLELTLAVEQAFEAERLKKREWKDACERYITRTQDALRFHREPKLRLGGVVAGKFVPSARKEPAKRNLTLNPLTGKMIERKKSAI